MVAGSITAEVAVAVPAERMWKATFGEAKSVLLAKACAGYAGAVEVDGDGGPGSVTTMKLNPSLGGEIKAFKTRVVVLGDAARVVKTEVLQGDSTVSVRLKTHVAEFKVEDAGEGARVFKMKVDYESTDDGAALAPEDEAVLLQGYICLTKMVEAYLVAHPEEFA